MKLFSVTIQTKKYKPPLPDQDIFDQWQVNSRVVIQAKISLTYQKPDYMVKLYFSSSSNSPETRIQVLQNYVLQMLSQHLASTENTTL